MGLIDSVYKEPEKWRSTEYSFVHDSGASVWVANGVFFCQPENGSFSLLTKIRMHRAFRWWCKNAPVEAFSRKASRLNR
tara:strand:- start:27 stop:263 length:237 start_codon:yes stop_codon:yes gene_type:complete